MVEADWSYAAAASQKTQRLPARDKEGFHYTFQREHGPANTLILGFQPPKL